MRKKRRSRTKCFYSFSICQTGGISMERVYLFAPGSSEKKILKALELGVDAVIIDLEDAVVSSEKEKARQLVYTILNSPEIEDCQSKIYVRINSHKTPWFFEDIELIKKVNRLEGVMIPKSEDRTTISLAAELLNRDIEIIPLIESAVGVNNIDEVLIAHPSVRKVAFGSVDFALDIGVEWTEDGLERIHAMGKIVLASRALGVEPPIDAVFPIIENKDSFLEDAKKGKQIGFYGKMVIHPKQIDWVQEVYRTNQKQIEWSKKVIDVFETAEHKGAIDLDGKLIDLPVYLLAKRLIAGN